MDSVQTATTAQPTEELTELGKCMMKHEVSLKRIREHSEGAKSIFKAVSRLSVFLFSPQNIYMTLLTLSFTSLSWKDTTNCHRTASMVCWTLLRQVAHLIQQVFNKCLDVFNLSCHTLLLKDKTFCIVVFHKFHLNNKPNTVCPSLFISVFPAVSVNLFLK